MAQRLGDKLLKRFPELDLVIGPNMIGELSYILKHGKRQAYTGFSECIYPKTYARSNKLKTYVSVILGCDNYCSYCIVPYVRGKPRSRDRKEIIKEIREYIDVGCKEITLLGQNILAYGRDIHDSFERLLSEVNNVPNLKRIRFITSHPRDVTPKLIKSIAQLDKVCEHFHLPIQSGSNKILKLMNRGYTVEYYKDIVALIRQIYPEVSITTDLIVGFPGETEDDFYSTLELIKTLKFDAVFCFKFSPREGTPAERLPEQIPESEKLQRLEKLIEIQKQITTDKNRNLIGSIQEVLIDEKNPRDINSLLGRTRTDKVVSVPAEMCGIGDIVKVKIIEATTYTLKGIIC
jgi:tRNA-2-methylthio-N6-dimethylallyladenosine synthase